MTLRDLHAVVAAGRQELDAEALMAYALAERPTRRGDCQTAETKLRLAAKAGTVPLPGDYEDGSNAARPCPWMGCKYHAAVDQTVGDGLNFSVGPEQLHLLSETCTLDLADRGGTDDLVTIGEVLWLSRERVRQLYERGLEKVGQQVRKRANDL